MRNSVLFRRIILLLLSAVILSGLLSAGIYIFVTQQMYVQMKADELMPIARSVAEMAAETFQNNSNGFRGERHLFERGNKDFLGALLHIYDSERKAIMNTPQGSDKGKPPPHDDIEWDEIITNDLNDILVGKEISVVRNSADRQSYLIVGVPIEDNGTIVGAIVFTKPMSELSDAMSGFHLTLIISTFAAFLVMLIPGYFIARRIVVPIRRMEDVARAMSNGDFSVRADESQKGEVGGLARSMNRFAEESGRLEQTRRDYVANVSHELRTPIAAIRAMGETLRDGMAKTEEKREMFYNNIVRESMRLSRLVDDLLELSRLQSGAAVMQKIRFDLREVIRNTFDIYSHVAEESGIKLNLNVNMEDDIFVLSSPDRIEQILVILFDNAIKHTPESGVITLMTSDKGNYIEVCVSNTGESISQEDLPHIFERFYKTDKSHSGNGTGLGLSIAYEILNALCESITAESGSGITKFIFTVHKN